MVHAFNFTSISFANRRWKSSPKNSVSTVVNGYEHILKLFLFFEFENHSFILFYVILVFLENLLT